MSYVKANTIVINARSQGRMIVTAESCTGGLVAATLTDVPGASKALDRGFVTYSNAAKVDELGVASETIERFGAVSAETAREMARGALAHSAADIAIAVTGVAGPDGGSVEKPVGLVHFACARRGEEPVLVERRFGPLSRAEIRAGAVEQALDLLLSALEAP